MSRDAGHETTLRGMWRQEFAGYSRPRFTHDLRAGLTVAAAGLATAIVGGALIGALGGAPYQISGPTGAMSAVLIVVAQKHGERGLWLAGLMAGVVILLLGLFRLGRIINVIPAPVITGFTSGIAPVIFTGQIDNAFGIHTPRARERRRQAARLRHRPSSLGTAIPTTTRFFLRQNDMRGSFPSPSS